MKNWSDLLLTIVFVAFCLETNAEGWKEICPLNSTSGHPLYNYGFFYSASPANTNDQRIHIHIKSPGEKIYFGFHWFNSGGETIRILDPSGNPVKTCLINSVNGSPGYINDYTQATAGPSVLNPAGYNALEYTPATTGEYMFDVDDYNVSNTFEFDMTVVDTTSTPWKAIPGRVWCKVWHFMANFGMTGTLFGLSADSVVTSVDLNGLNGNPLHVTLNHNGLFLPPTPWIISRQSVAGVPPAGFPYLENKIFLNDPDSLVYPSGVLGEIDNNSLIVTPDCNGTVNIGFSVNKPGWVELLIKIDPGPTIQPVDVMISDSVFGGANTIIWNGLDGLGQAVQNGISFSINVKYLNGLTNLPVWPTAGNPNGFIVQLQRPAGATPLIYWDDRQIDPTKYNLTGCLSSQPSTGCHSWSISPPYAVYNGINTWWYASNSSTNSPKVLFKRSFISITDTTVCMGDTVIWRGQEYHIAGTYHQNYSSILTSCDSSYTLHLVNLPVPAVNLGPDTTICTGQTFTFDAGFCTGCTYQWANLTLGQMNIGTSQTYTANQSGLYMATVTGINGCKGRDTVNLTIGPPTTVSVSIYTSANSICSGTQVTYTAIPTNPGTTPIYLWKVNGVNAGSNNSVFSYTPANGDQVQCILTSSITVCISNNPASSNVISMIVNPLLPVSVSISASANNVCAGTPVTFTAMPINGGSVPSYQWKVNGIPAGTNSPVYAYVPLNNDAVTCSLNSSEACATGNPATSPGVIMIVNPQLPVSVSISASSNPFCIGTPVSITASPANGGPLAAYQWKVNGVNAGVNAPIFTYNPVSGDVVTCLLTSSLQCVLGNPAVSNSITLTGNPGLPASVAIAANPNPFCPGTPVVFTAVPGNGGTSPVYQWKVNGINAGSNSPSFTYNPSDNDSVRCVMTSNLVCVSSNPTVSNKIIMSGSLAPPVSLSLCVDSITTVGAKPFKLKGGLPLGGTWSGPGVNSLTGVFNPANAGTGLKTIVYSYTNVYLCSASKTKTVTVQPNAVFTCGNTLTDIRDNKTYPTVQIGTQCWMAANLNRGAQISSSQVQFDNCTDEKYCFGNDAAKCSKYGGLYQWDEMMHYDDTPAGQGLCPPGWHIPTDNDWTVLCNFYNGNGFAGKPLQDTIISGFRALTGGVFYLNSSWSFADFAVLFWTSSSWGSYKALSHGMNTINFSVSLYPSSRANAFPVRCLHD